MITFRFRSEDNKDILVNAPERWEEVTVDTFCNPAFLSRDSLSMLSALSGIDRPTLLNSTADITPQLLKMVAFISTNPEGFSLNKKPKKFTLMGKECQVPIDIELERVGQKIMFQDSLVKHKFIYQGIPEAMAIYLIPELNDGKFDDAMIPEVSEEIRKLRIVDVFPIANFFLSSYKRLVKNGKLY